MLVVVLTVDPHGEPDATFMVFRTDRGPASATEDSARTMVMASAIATDSTEQSLFIERYSFS